MQVAALLLFAAFAGVAVHHLLRREHGGGARRTRCADLQGGWVEVRGHVEASRELRAPISGRRAAGYWLVIEQERGPTAWEPVVVIAELGPFELRDETGSVPVRADARLVHADIFEQRGSGGPFAPLPGRVERLLHEHQRSTQGVLFGKAFRWREQVLEPGHEVAIRGWAQRSLADDGEVAAAGGEAAPGPRGPYRTTPTQWVLEASPRRPMQLLDLGERARRPFGWRRFARA